jgi:hypothetical protein
VHKRATAWLRRHRYVDERPLEAHSNETPEQSAIDACAAIAMQRGAFAKLATADDSDDDNGTNGEPARLRFTVEHEGFNLHAGVYIAAEDDAGRERLMRLCRCLHKRIYAELPVMRSAFAISVGLHSLAGLLVRITELARRVAIRRSGGRNLPGRRMGGFITASASSFSVGSACR